MSKPETFIDKLSEMVDCGILEKEHARFANGKLRSIARGILRIETLDTRMSDSLDFHAVSVWSISHALTLAFIAGLNYNYRGEDK